ncbi:hypothetical protein [Kitasatospora sp. GP82]|uniref:hypothetical protein n=1 Tax=Kitasatospora sp. GP82 TaxID=3035089 RepID=UPI002474C7C0|nr:hypothetical protein [Kitasatospora sp. GP82]MDH6125956.1 hypothetical protein [Kitasatospora sp. GP82]
MAKKSNIHRPTEDTAIGLALMKPKAVAGLNRLQAMLALAVRRHDWHGARLIRNLLARAMAGGKVGEACAP